MTWPPAITPPPPALPLAHCSNHSPWANNGPGPSSTGHRNRPISNFGASLLWAVKHTSVWHGLRRSQRLLRPHPRCTVQTTRRGQTMDRNTASQGTGIAQSAILVLTCLRLKTHMPSKVGSGGHNALADRPTGALLNPPVAGEQ